MRDNLKQQIGSFLVQVFRLRPDSAEYWAGFDPCLNLAIDLILGKSLHTIIDEAESGEYVLNHDEGVALKIATSSKPKVTIQFKTPDMVEWREEVRKIGEVYEDFDVEVI